MNATAPKKSPKPVLACVRMIATSAGLTLEATDLEVSVRREVTACEVDESGAVIVSAEKLAGALGDALSPTVEIEQKGDGITLIAGRDTMRIEGYPCGEWPVCDEPDNVAFDINGGSLSKMLTCCLGATARESSRYAINGVYIEGNGRVSFVATDGRRLILFDTAVKGEGFACILPSKAASLVKSSVGMDDTVMVRANGERIAFDAPGLTIVSQLAEGNFPPFRDVIPKDKNRTAKVSVDQFAHALRVCERFTTEETRGVRLAFDANGLAVMTAKAAEVGEAQSTVDVESYTGEPITIGFAPDFMRHALTICEGDSATIEMSAPNKPAVIREGGAVAVVMPVNIEA